MYREFVRIFMFAAESSSEIRSFKNPASRHRHDWVEQIQWQNEKRRISGQYFLACHWILKFLLRNGFGSLEALFEKKISDRNFQTWSRLLDVEVDFTNTAFSRPTNVGFWQSQNTCDVCLSRIGNSKSICSAAVSIDSLILFFKDQRWKVVESTLKKEEKVLGGSFLTINFGRRWMPANCL